MPIWIDVDWQLRGEVRVDPTGRLGFPAVDKGPALYRLWIESADERPSVYVGETGNLVSRLRSYRTPGVGQPTNLRVRKALLDALRAGAKVTLWTAIEARVAFDAAEPRALDLSRKNQRLVAEQAAIAEALLAEDLGDIDADQPVRPRLLNKPGVGELPYD